MTGNDSLSCRISLSYCPSGDTPREEGIHSHPFRYRVTRNLRQTYPNHIWKGRIGYGYGTLKFSETDKNYLKLAEQGLYLARGIKGNIHLPYKENE